MSETKDPFPEPPTDFVKVVSNDFRKPGIKGNSETGHAIDATLTGAILIPRWVVYFQAALLGIIATTFFVFGLMVGCLTSGQSNQAVKTQPCVVSGIVQFDSAKDTTPDVGAVVFLLPKNRRPEERSPGNLVSPSGFEPLNNPGIEIINRLGGAIVRTDEFGKFNLTVDGSGAGIDYFVLVVSKNKRADEPGPMSKQQVAVIGTFFMPVDRVIDGQAYYWTNFTARSDSAELGVVEF